MQHSLLLLALPLLLLACASILPASASTNNDAACAELFNGTLTPLARASVAPNVCAAVWATGLGKARSLLVLPRPPSHVAADNRNETDDAPLPMRVLVVDATAGRIILLSDTDGSGSIDSPDEQTTLVTLGGLNHGLALWQPLDGSGTRLCASTASTVYSWPLNISDPSALLSPTPDILVSNMPVGGHGTRTLIVSPDQRYLFVSVGSEGNIDTNAMRSLIWRFDLSEIPSGGTFVYGTHGSRFAGGLRNEVALAFDSHGIMWGAENGADQLSRSDLGGDIHNGNPGEEINRFTSAAASGAEAGDRFYGYPYCFSEYALPSKFARGRGSQWAWPSFLSDGLHTDDWCRDTNNVVTPAFVMQAHTAPLGMMFYSANSSAEFAFPRPIRLPGAPSSIEDGWLYVTQHGSWNRDPPTGYALVRVRSRDDGSALSLLPDDGGDPEPVLVYDHATAATGPGWIRPVDIVQGNQGELLVSDDANGQIIALRFVRGVNQTVQALTAGASTLTLPTLTSLGMLALTAACAAWIQA